MLMNGVGTITDYFDNRFQNTNILTYDNTFGAHHITVTGVAEDIFSKFNRQFNDRTGFSG